MSGRCEKYVAQESTGEQSYYNIKNCSLQFKPIFLQYLIYIVTIPSDLLYRNTLYIYKLYISY